MKIEQLIAGIIEREGGYVDHKADRGGPTCWGITEAVARAFGYTGPMADLTKQQAAVIYLTRYWVQPRFDAVGEIAPTLAEKLADVGVNMGTGVAARFLQRALNVLNQGDALYPNVVVDGAIGNMSLASLRALLAKRGPEGAAILKDMIEAQQRVRYMEIAEGDTSQEAFEYGWQRRAGEL